MPVENRVGDENDGWRVTNVTLRFERGTAFAQHIITMRAQVRKLVALARAAPHRRRHRLGRPRPAPQGRPHRGRRRGALADDADVHRRGRAHRRAGAVGSAVKLRYSELSQEIAETALRVIGPADHRRPTSATIATAQAVREYLWSLQYTIAAGTSQIQRNLIAERILGLPKGR